MFTTLWMPCIPGLEPRCPLVEQDRTALVVAFGFCSEPLIGGMSGWYMSADTLFWDGQPLLSSSFSLAQPLALIYNPSVTQSPSGPLKREWGDVCLFCPITASTSSTWNGSTAACSQTQWQALWESSPQHQDNIPNLQNKSRTCSFFGFQKGCLIMFWLISTFVSL